MTNRRLCFRVLVILEGCLKRRKNTTHTVTRQLRISHGKTKDEFSNNALQLLLRDEVLFSTRFSYETNPRHDRFIINQACRSLSFSSRFNDS